MTDNKPVILFVDDEQQILDGLRRKLGDQEDIWDMRFAGNALEALDIMDSVEVDVLITDMRMPGMDGAALLDEARQSHPRTARFILSGFSERQSLFRTLGPAHQYFVKPCDTRILVQAVERTLEFRHRLHSPELLAVVAGAKAIPALPKALSELFSELQSPNGSAAEAARIISSDIALTAQVLKLVNSAYFVLPTKVSDILQAVKLLGFELIRSVVALAGMFDTFRTAGVDLAAIEHLESRSLIIGAVSAAIARREKMETALVAQCQCAGMLAHVGSLILFANRSREMAAMQRQLDMSGGGIIDAEEQQFGTNHADLGACLLSLWGFTDSVAEAVLCHHAPSKASAFCSQTLGATAIVHAAQHLVKPEAVIGDLDLTYLARVGVIDHLPGWVDETALILRECRE